MGLESGLAVTDVLYVSARSDNSFILPSVWLRVLNSVNCATLVILVMASVLAHLALLNSTGILSVWKQYRAGTGVLIKAEGVLKVKVSPWRTAFLISWVSFNGLSLSVQYLKQTTSYHCWNFVHYRFGFGFNAQTQRKRICLVCAIWSQLLTKLNVSFLFLGMRFMPTLLYLICKWSSLKHCQLSWL